LVSIFTEALKVGAAYISLPGLQLHNAFISLSIYGSISLVLGSVPFQLVAAKTLFWLALLPDEKVYILIIFFNLNFLMEVFQNMLVA
jgi:hypothetical protein